MLWTRWTGSRYVIAASGFNDSSNNVNLTNSLEKTMWSKPEYTEMRFGFEVTMYIANR